MTSNSWFGRFLRHNKLPKITTWSLIACCHLSQNAAVVGEVETHVMTIGVRQTHSSSDRQSLLHDDNLQT